MAAYLFELELPEFTDELVQTIPIHREKVNHLFAEGKLLAYSVAFDRTKIWCVVNAEEEAEALEVIAQFPLHRFFTDIVCHPLLFHNALPASLPGISLN